MYVHCDTNVNLVVKSKLTEQTDITTPTKDYKLAMKLNLDSSKTLQFSDNFAF